MHNVVFLHGILGDEETWKNAFQYLPDSITAHSYTLSGFGEHAQIIHRLDTNVHALELIEFCQSLDSDKITVIAWSYSCHVALLAALQAPKLFSAIHLYDCIVPSYGLESDPEASKQFSKDLMQMMSPVIKALRNTENSNLANSFTLACTHNQTQLTDQSEVIQHIKQRNAQTVAKLLEQVSPQPITPETLQSLTVPCGIYWGESSRQIFKLTSQMLYKNLPNNIRLQSSGEIKDADHLLPENNPVRLLQRIFQGI